MKQVTIYTDGACSGNPGPGGWGAVRTSGAHEKELSGGEPSSTHNRMERLGASAALFFWVKGHADNVYNNRCDALAVAEREKFA